MVTSNVYHIISENDIVKANYNTTTSHIRYNLSIIIPTYKNTEYIDECINSILESSENLNVELLIGIDACEETLNHIKTKKYPYFIKFYYFNENVGPYLIKNSLVKITNSDNILFFDSDDIMLKPTLNTIVTNIQKYDCVRLKLQNYTNGTITKNNVNYGEGVFAINKQLFLSMNGFEPWRVAADSDFMGRLYNKRPRIFHIPEVSFYYRQHSSSLTKRSDTGMSSQLRAGYHKLSKNKKGSGNPEVLHISNFSQITIDTYEIPKEFDYNNIVRREKLNSVLNPTPRKTIEKPQKKQFSEPTTTRLDELFKNTSNPARVIKTKTPENRQELIDLKNNTTKKTINELFPKKPNYKDGKNFINIGGKFTK
jgi:glycosyltransferase involved in cell wall biosynthesis